MDVTQGQPRQQMTAKGKTEQPEETANRENNARLPTAATKE